MPPTFASIRSVRRGGFTGFVRIDDLRRSLDVVPRVRGVYLVLRDGDGPPRFRHESPAGHFKGKDPTIPAGQLRRRWIDGTPVLYIGKAGGPGVKATLHSRIRQYIRHGQGGRSAHWGGRAIWQLTNNHRLMFAWTPTPGAIPREIEKDLIESFVERFGARPFANRTG